LLNGFLDRLFDLDQQFFYLSGLGLSHLLVNECQFAQAMGIAQSVADQMFSFHTKFVRLSACLIADRAEQLRMITR
jgi:hypothetical protein